MRDAKKVYDVADKIFLMLDAYNSEQLMHIIRRSNAEEWHLNQADLERAIALANYFEREQRGQLAALDE